ncbi:MAG: ATP-binding cassette, subfamily multidrug efflux pump [Acidobacteriaceae bacterium]|nr:ATP-binding cassette, subfamily multidrug efflux pump [Acidobacteriaceae bacterium]
MSQEEEILGKAYDSRLMARLLKYLRPYRWQVAIALASIVVKSFADVLGPYLTKVAIDRYLAPAKDVSSGLWSWLNPRAITGIAQIAAIYVGLLVMSFLLEFLQTYFMQWTGQKVMFDLRRQIFRHLQRLHVAFFDKNPVGRLVTRVTTDVDALNEMFTSGVVSIFEDLFVLVGILGVMLCMNWKLALITFAVLPFIVVATKIFRDRVRDSYRRIRVAIARINSYLQEHVSGMVVLQLFNRERKAYDRFSEINRNHMDAFKDAIMAYSVYYPVVEILSAIAIACVIWFGGGDVMRKTAVTSVAVSFNWRTHVTFRLVRDGASLGVLVAFIQYALRFFRPIMDFSEKYNILQSAMAASERVFKLLDTSVQVVSPALTKSPEGPGRIEFDHVWFAYRDVDRGNEHVEKTDRVGTAALGRPAEPSSAGSSLSMSRAAASDFAPDWVLRDVTLTIEPGETVAIVGHTGAGKTTLISLLLRFYDVQKGAVRIDGVDVKDMDLADLRSRFGVVLQDPFLFSGTIRGNIRLGTKRIQDADVEKAAEDVNLADFIRALPKGFDEEVRERGSTLSTGQKQLISFARALAHEPKILILDEATSSVDTETEFRVRDALNRMVEGRTSLIIAHRLSTVQRADKIIVMHKSQVREMGTHQQLLAQRGIYFKLYQLQYKDQELNVARAPSPANADGVTEPGVTARGDD